MRKDNETVNAETAAKNLEAEAPVVKEPEKVELFVPRGQAGDEPNLFIGVNGVGYLLPRGVTSMVPPWVAKEYRLSQYAQNIQDENSSQMQQAAE